MCDRVIWSSKRIIGVIAAIALSIGAIGGIDLSGQSTEARRAEASAEAGRPPAVDSTTFGDLRPRALGPATTSGRISSIDVVNDNPRIVYAGTAGGGVWKSTNGGGSFSAIFDEHIMSIGAVAVDQSKPDTVWVGTGESWPRNSVSVGRGMFKSTDAGRSWTAVGLEKTERIARLAIHPKQSDTVFACALGHLWNANEDRGVFRTTDGGKTWQKVHYVDADTGCGDLAIDPQEPEVIYAAMYQVRRRPDFFVSGGPGSGLYKSKDGGKTWRKVTAGLPTGDLGRIGLAVAASRPGTVYAIVEAKETALYRSDDAGESWKTTTEGEAFFGVRARPFYFANVKVDPTDHTRVYNFSLFLTVSSNAGRSFELSGSNPFGGMHPDHHAMWINPRDPYHMLMGTDGGVYVSRDRGTTWSFSASLPVAQFYHVTVDGQRPYRVYGGLQDNGSWSAPSQRPGGIRNRDWTNVGFGDGFNVFPDPRDTSIVFSEFQGAQIRRLNTRTGEMKDIRPRAAAGEPKLSLQLERRVHAEPQRRVGPVPRRPVRVSLARSRRGLGAHLTRSDDERSGEAAPERVGRPLARQHDRGESLHDRQHRRVAAGAGRHLGRHRRRQRAGHARWGQELDERRQERPEAAGPHLGLDGGGGPAPPRDRVRRVRRPPQRRYAESPVRHRRLRQDVARDCGGPRRLRVPRSARISSGPICFSPAPNSACSSAWTPARSGPA